MAKKIIKRHQNALEDSHELAIDRLGLSLLNSYYGPDKFNYQVQHLNDTVRFNYSADLPLSQF